MSIIKITFLTLFFNLLAISIWAQGGTVKGKVTELDGERIAEATVSIPKLKVSVPTDSLGEYQFINLPLGTWQMEVRLIGFDTKRSTVVLDKTANQQELDFTLIPQQKNLDDVVITGTMRAVSRLESPIPVEVYSPNYFKKNPTPSLFDAISMVNGVQPQLNCNVCNTGDIHINGMEGPYTMILIDGMPIVSALSSVYGLSGIPNSLVERIEIVKGPGSSLYGSEAMGGIINVITKNPLNAPLVTADVMGTTWGEANIDAGIKFKAGKATSILGVNYFNFQNKIDKNNDNFTDMTLQNRISLFNKWAFSRKSKKAASLAARYVYEDRWGGEMNWNTTHRGSGDVYGESVYTKRFELLGVYQLPVKENITTQFSYNFHDQDSWYGDKSYIAQQQVGFMQAFWDKEIGKAHNFLLGASMRYTVYDDNTPATASADGNINAPEKTPLPGIFIQDEWKISTKNTFLAGYRFDYDQNHGVIQSPRIAYKFAPNSNNTIRASFGTGFRVVNLFTEDHAALTGARDVVIVEKLNPEKSYNGTLNYVLNIPARSFYVNLDVTGFYSYFTNKIMGDFDIDPTKIIYNNLEGHAVSNGISINSHFTFDFPLTMSLGVSYMDVYQKKNIAGIVEKIQQLHAPKWSGNFAISYALPKAFSIDFTGNFYGPMRLPIQPNDFRPEYSPWFTIANIQITKKLKHGIEIYGGVKNLLNFTPKHPLMRPFDPFDKTAGDIQSNPYGYTFDTEYNYASQQGIRGFLGLRYNLWK